MSIESYEVNVCFINIHNNRLSLEGTYNGYELPFLQLQADNCIYDNQRTDCDNYPPDRRPFLFTLSVTDGLFSAPFSVPQTVKLQFQSVKPLICSIVFGKFSPLQKRYIHSYYYKDGFSLTWQPDALLLSCSQSKKAYRSRLRKEMLRSGTRGMKDYLLRFFKLHFPAVSKNIWLISDRVTSGGDNGEALFRYVNSETKTKSFFAIAKTCPDYVRMKQYGKVIPFGGFRYKILYLTGAVLISSQGEDVIFHPFRQSTAAFSDLVQDTKYVFLQHGVIKDDMSDWLNRFQKNISIFVCTTRPEYESILHAPYDYTARQVKLTGLPRHDLLSNAPEQLVTIMFTWRKYLVELPDTDNIRKLKDGFTESSYYKIHKQILQDARLSACLHEHGCRMQVVLHPCMEQAQPILSALTDEYPIVASADYNRIFRTSSLLVTDYSSTAFDFALLRKPTIYCQADREEFFSGDHMYRAGYFDYEQDGFGDVATTVSACIDRICESISRGFPLSEKYAARINETFPYGNSGNCERVYQAILQMTNQNSGNDAGITSALPARSACNADNNSANAVCKGPPAL